MIGDFSIRKATLPDVKLYYGWVNEVEVRKTAFNQEIITWENHKLWFEDKIQSDGTYLLVLEHKSKPVGQIRFDLNDEGAWEIDYSLDTEFRGLGYGKIIIQEGIEYLCTKVDEPKIIAKVKSQNEPSKRTFVNLGFVEMQKGDTFLYKYK
ncbi:MAG: GNAT family N-acetyltransferase [Colwellia sp.]|nr:GNAT family N-acetyltransferase [Colwellia sp.]